VRVAEAAVLVEEAEVLFDEESLEVLFEVAVAVALPEAAASPAAAAFPAEEEDLEEALPALATAPPLAFCTGAAATEEMAIKAKRAAVNFIV